MTDSLRLAAILVEDDPEAAADLLATLPSATATAFMAELPEEVLPQVVGHVPETLARALLGSLELEAAARVLADMEYPFKTQVARALPTSLLRQLLERLSRRDARQIRRDLTYALDSVGAWMVTATTVFDVNMTVGEILSILRKRRRRPDATLVLIDTNKVYAGLVNGSVLLGAAERQPVKRYLDTKTKALMPESLIFEINGSEAWHRYLSLPVVGRNGALLGILHRERLHDALVSETPEEEMAGEMGGVLGHLMEGALVCAAGFSTMFTSADPGRVRRPVERKEKPS
ncbi:hypothetical protein JCM17960_05320 [Magnetospira thiophila]